MKAKTQFDAPQDPTRLVRIKYIGGPAQGVYRGIGDVHVGQTYMVDRKLADEAIASGQFVAVQEESPNS